jgi:hypothetical protein
MVSHISEIYLQIPSFPFAINALSAAARADCTSLASLMMSMAKVETEN